MRYVLLLCLIVLLSGCVSTFVGASIGDAAADRAQRPGFAPFTEAVEVLAPEQRLDLQLSTGEIVKTNARAVTVRSDSVFVETRGFARHDVTGVQVLRRRPGYVLLGMMAGTLVDYALCMRFCNFGMDMSGTFSGLF